MTQPVSIRLPLTNLQMELLDLFTLQLRRIISLYLLEQTRDEADKAWKEKGYDEGTIQRLLDN